MGSQTSVLLVLIPEKIEDFVKDIDCGYHLGNREHPKVLVIIKVE